MRITAYILLLPLLLYPLIVYLFHGDLSPAALGAILICLAGLRILLVRKNSLSFILGFLCLSLLFLAILFNSNEIIYLKLYPSLVNIGFLIAFCVTLYKPPSMIERIARFSGTEMSAQGIIYTRGVTKIWCVFFVVNGTLSTWLAIKGTTAQWAAYTSLYSYIGMGALFAGEYLYRSIYQRRHRKLGA
jgi:uncharacterized membrane protein